MVWQTSKTNWRVADVVSKDDFNRIADNAPNPQGNQIYYVERGDLYGMATAQAGLEGGGCTFLE